MNKFRAYAAALAFAALIGWACQASAMTVTWSAYNNRYLTLQGGTNGVPVGSLVALGNFGTLTDGEIASIGANPTAIWAAFSSWATGNVGDGTSADPDGAGTFAIYSTATGTGFFNEPAYLVAFNASTAASATQVGVFKGPSVGDGNGDAWIFPATDTVSCSLDLSQEGMVAVIGSLSSGTVTSPPDIAGGDAASLAGKALIWSASKTRVLTLQGGTNGVGSGGLVELGILGTNTEARLKELRNDPSALDAAFVDWASSSVGAGTGIDGSFIQSSAGPGAGFFNQQIYLLVFNAPTAAAATQVGLFTNPTNPKWIFPSADPVFGSLDLSDEGMVAVIGTNTSGTVTWPAEKLGYDAACLVAVPAVEFLDPNPSLLDQSGQIVSTVSLLATTGTVVTGVAADGVTPVLLRMPSDTSVTFSLASGNSADGLLRAVGSSDPGNTNVTVSPQSYGGTNWVFAIYTAPVDFSEAPTTLTSRSIQFLVAGPSTMKTGSVQLVRPPVVLVHGVWSDPESCWIDVRFDMFLKLQGFEVSLADYSTHSASGFDPEHLPNFPVQAVITAINGDNRPKAKLRRQGIAVTQVDVVGHSMGALATRAYASRSDFKRRDNFFKGDIHKLITIGTPHLGSPLANFLVRHATDYLGTRWDGTSKADLFKWFGKPVDKGAIVQLQTGNDVLTKLVATPFPGHAIVGDADTGQDPPATQTERVMNKLLNAIEWGATVNGIFGGVRNDTIVSEPSQKGGLNLPFTDKYRPVVHAAYPGDTNETSSLDIKYRVEELLRASVSSGQFANFPPPSTVMASSLMAGQPAEMPGIASSQANVRESASDTNVAPGLVLTSPTNGQVFHPGDTISLQAATTNSVTMSNVVFMIEGDAIIPTSGPPFQVAYTIPMDFAGSRNILVIGTGDDGLLYADVLTITVQPTANLTALELLPPVTQFSYVAQSDNLFVLGDYDDGVQRNITSASAGTTYTTLSGSSLVIAVSSNGMVTARGNGVDTIVISNSGLSTTVVVNVQISQTMDTVGDGIPDYWRAQYFPNVDPTGMTTGSLSCATCDADGTGQNNLFKYLAGLDPTNAASRFVLRIETVDGQPDQKNLIFKPWAAGRAYTTQFTTNLVGTEYGTLDGIGGPTTNGSEVTITDLNAVEPQKFYRIKISLP